MEHNSSKSRGNGTTKKRQRMDIGFIVRVISWAMVLVAIFAVTMTFLSTFYIWVTELFMTAKTLIAVLCVTFSLWSLRNFLDSRIYPIYKIQGVLFLILALIAGFLLTTAIF